MASIRKLEPTDDVSGFRSGNESLDTFLHRFAAPNQFALHASVTYLAIEGADIVGYITVASAEGQAADYEKLKRRKLPRYPLPMLRLARLAVAQAWQRRGIGNALVSHAFALALKMAREIGCVGVVVDPKPDSVEYYRKLGFEPRAALEGHGPDPSGPPPMFLPMDMIKKALKAR
jgi:predicted N-acetyltransferase YhbS